MDEKYERQASGSGSCPLNSYNLLLFATGTKGGHKVGENKERLKQQKKQKQRSTGPPTSIASEWSPSLQPLPNGGRSALGWLESEEQQLNWIYPFTHPCYCCWPPAKNGNLAEVLFFFFFLCGGATKHFLPPSLPWLILSVPKKGLLQQLPLLGLLAGRWCYLCSSAVHIIVCVCISVANSTHTPGRRVC